MNSDNLERQIRQLFVNDSPKTVINTWNKVLKEFADAFKPVSTEKATQTTILEDIKPEPKSQNVLVTPDTSANKLKKHKELIAKKRQEIVASGINPDSVLTDENIRQWIGVEGKTYWTIAEMTGCSDSDISARAKTLGVISQTALLLKQKKARLM